MNISYHDAGHMAKMATMVKPLLKTSGPISTKLGMYNVASKTLANHSLFK